MYPQSDRMIVIVRSPDRVNHVADITIRAGHDESIKDVCQDVCQDFRKDLGKEQSHGIILGRDLARFNFPEI